MKNRILTFIFIIFLFVLAIPNDVLAAKSISSNNVTLSYYSTTYTGGS